MAAIQGVSQGRNHPSGQTNQRDKVRLALGPEYFHSGLSDLANSGCLGLGLINTRKGAFRIHIELSTRAPSLGYRSLMFSFSFQVPVSRMSLWLYCVPSRVPCTCISRGADTRSLIFKQHELGQNWSTSLHRSAESDDPIIQLASP